MLLPPFLTPPQEEHDGALLQVPLPPSPPPLQPVVVEPVGAPVYPVLDIPVDLPTSSAEDALSFGSSASTHSPFASAPSSPMGITPPEVYYLLHQPLHSDPDRLHRGDIIVVVHEGTWSKAKLSSHSSLAERDNGSLYWNYAYLDGSHARGSYLHRGKSWGVLRREDIEMDLSSINFVIPPTEKGPSC